MSVPHTDDDQRLSDHLDGYLSASDADLLQKHLETNVELANRFAQLKADRESLRGAFARSAASTSNKLPATFATDVVAEAMRRQGTEPVRLADQPTRGRSVWVASALVIAAALLLMVSLKVMNNSAIESTGQPLALQTESDGLVVESSPELETIAVADIQTPAVAKAAAMEMSPAADVPIDTITESKVALETPREEMANSNVLVPRIASVGDRAREVDQMRDSIQRAEGADTVKSVDALGLGAMLVYDIRRTESGIDSRAVAAAMDRIGFAETNKQPINQDIVQVAERATQSGADEKFRILFLKAPAKQLDRLFSELVADKTGVASVGMSLATEAPILRLAQTLQKVDATKVRQSNPAVSFELQAEQDSNLRALSALLGERAFLPVRSNQSMVGVMGGTAGQSRSGAAGVESGIDVLSQVLLLVR